MRLGFRLSLLRRVRAGLLLGGVVLVVGLATSGMAPEAHARWVDRLGFSLEAARAWRVWTFPAATIFQADPGLTYRFWLMVWLVTASVAVLEWQVGSLRAIATFLLSDWVAAPLLLLALGALAHLGNAAAGQYLHQADTGSSGAAYGALVAAAVLLPRRWMGLALAALGAWFGLGFAIERIDVAIGHVIAAAVGLLLGLFWRRASRRTPPASER